MKSGEKRLFEVREAAPRHTWPKSQKLAAVIISIAITAAVCVVIPLLTAYINSFEEMNSYYDEAPPDLIFYYNFETEHIPSE